MNEDQRAAAVGLPAGTTRADFAAQQLRRHKMQNVAALVEICQPQDARELAACVYPLRVVMDTAKGQTTITWYAGRYKQMRIPVPL
ncbi:hypothetical protein KE423_003901 [Salmonella enterica]|nr:hypothetical protein [Salmonella enterica]